MKVLFIGTGVMGGPMALNLAKNNVDVTVYNRTVEKAKALEPHVKVATDLVFAAKHADIIFSIVGYPSDVKEVYETIIPHCKKGTILVDMTTSSVSLAIELNALAKQHGLEMLDAPVTGGDSGAINGTLSIMAGGDESTYHTIYPYLTYMGKTITYMGNPGSGQTMKLANQITIAGNILGIAEGLYFAKEKGLNLEDVYKVITGGSASSWQAIHNGKKMIIKDYQPGFYVKHFLKDLKLALEESKELDLPLLKLAEKAYSILSKLHNDSGTQAIIEYYLNQENKKRLM
ncbi:MAG: NAD(P)-dependent oxidoreductase [Acholeplasmataceae bacterium]|nr:NAD(P)-dependent oxidoreductase [Acholeplasmataceae bacterium]